MKAIVCTKYGPPDVLRLRERETPVPKESEVLVKVHAAAVTAADSMMRKGEPFYARLFLGLLRPKNPVPGTGFSGEIEAVGKDVTLFKKGDQVFGETGVRFGAYAEYLCVPQEGLLERKPASMTHEEAAPVCDGALTGLNFLRELGKIRSGQRVLINGASGGLGTSAVQLAKHFGAVVTGVCSTANLELVKSLGADHVVDYTKVDFTKTGQTYDIIYDTVGKSSFSRCKRSLTEDGVYLSPVLGLPLLFRMVWTSAIGSKKAKFSATGLRPVSELRRLLKELLGLLESEAIRSVIGRRFPLEQTAEAHRYVDTGHKTGNVVITLEPGNKA